MKGLRIYLIATLLATSIGGLAATSTFNIGVTLLEPAKVALTSENGIQNLNLTGSHFSNVAVTLSTPQGEQIINTVTDSNGHALIQAQSPEQKIVRVIYS